MAIPATGPVSLAQIQAEFGGDIPISLSEYYRNGALTTSNNTSVATGSAGTTITMSGFRGAVRALIVEYQIIGAGGAGGYGNWNSYASTRSASGGGSSLTGAVNVSVAGGVGGLDAYVNPGIDNPDRNGSGTTYGLGGIAGPSYQSETYSPGGAAPAGSYGAGGGGAGGDRSSTFDPSGGAGGSGQAGAYATGSFLLVPGTQIVVSIGSKGIGAGGASPGGNGANGFAKLRKDGGAWTDFTSGGTYTV